MNKQRGVTLVELMMTLIVLAILTVIALPSFEAVIRSNRTTALTNDILNTIALARSEAIRRSAPVSLCGSANGTACGGDWGQGWILFNDDNGDGEINGADSVVRQWGRPAGNASFAGMPNRLTFRANGTLAATATQNFSFALSGCRGDQRRAFALLTSGRLSYQKTGC